MPRRAFSAALLLLLIGVLLATPAVAKTGELDFLLITGPDGRPLEVLGGMLNGQLSEMERRDLYGQLLMGQNKGDNPPEGDLGPRYEFVYVLRDVYDEPLRVRETVYLEADPPVAFAPKGQSTELYPGDVRAVPWGWRPFPEAAVPAIFSLMEEAARERPPGGTAEWTIVPTWMMIMALVVLAALIWLCVKLLLRWRAAGSATP